MSPIRRPRLLPALAVVVFCATPLAAWGQTIEIRPNVEEGLELRYEHTNTTRAALPQGMGEMLQESVLVARSRVLSLDADGSGTMETEYESARLRNVTPMSTEAWDSTVDPEPSNPAFAFMARMVGRTTETRFGPGGQPEDLGAMLDDLMDDPEAGPVRDMMQETMSGLQAGIDGTPDFLTGPISVGESREMEMSLPVPMVGQMTMTRRYTLERVEDHDGAQVAVFRVSGTMEMGGEGDAPEAMSGMGISFGGGEVTGHMFFDLDRGIMIETFDSTSMTMEVMGERMVTVTEARLRLLP